MYMLGQVVFFHISQNKYVLCKQALYAAQVDLKLHLPGVAAAVPPFLLSDGVMGPEAKASPLTMYVMCVCVYDLCARVCVCACVYV